MQHTPLHAEYARHGAKVVDFHGWALPLQFKGILDEHRHVRRQAGVFDCSHMGEFIIQGRDAMQHLASLVIGDMVNLAEGKCRYTAILNDSGGIIDDCVVVRLTKDTLLLVTNAGPLDKVAALLDKHVPEIRNISGETAKIDVQGPAAPQVLLALGFSGADKMPFWTGRTFQWQGVETIITRAGYTGELGYELYVPNDTATELWRALTALPEVCPCGLGARDTLRTEMGYPLSGQDVDETRTPVEAGMDRFIAWNTYFPGKARLESLRDSGDYNVLAVLRSEDKRAPRHGFELKHNGSTVGVITSGTFGPSVGCGIGLGYVPFALAQPGVRLEAGPRSLPVVIETPPLYRHATGRKRIEVQDP